MMFAKKKIAIVAGAVIAAVGLGTGVSYAAVPDSGGVIHGCYHPQTDGHSSALGVIDTALSNGHCPSGQTEITWNQTGPQGATGPAGPPAGAGEVTGRTNFSIPFGHANGDTVSATANCPSGYTAVGGGFGPSGPLPSQQEVWTPFQSLSAGSGWFMSWEQTGTPSTASGSFTMSIFAYCLPTS